MKSGVLADTTVWIEFFKPDSQIGNALETLLIENTVWTCGVVLYELFQGIRSENERTKISETILSLPYMDISNNSWQKAAALSVVLRKKGLTLPLSDILIASLANEHNLAVFTIDKHFQQIPNLRLYEAPTS